MAHLLPLGRPDATLRLPATTKADQPDLPPPALTPPLGSLTGHGSLTDYPLTLVHQDGTLTDVLHNASVYRGFNEDALGVLAVARDATKLSAAAPQRATARSTEVTDRHRTSQGDHRPAPGGHDRSGLPAHTRTHPQQRRQLNTTHHRHAGERPLLTWGSLLRTFGILVHSSAAPRGLTRLLGHSSRPTGALFTPSPRVSVRAIAHDYVRAGPLGELDPQHQGDPEGWPRPGEGNSADQGPDLTTSTRGGMIMPFSKKRPSGTTPEPKCRVRGAGPTPADRSRNPERHSERSEERRVGKECRSRWSPYHE